MLHDSAFNCVRVAALAAGDMSIEMYTRDSGRLGRVLDQRLRLVLDVVEGAAYQVSKHDNGITAVLKAGDGGTMQLFSRPAAGRTPKEIAVDLVNQTFPDTMTAYEIPNTLVGYQQGYGLAADCWPQGAMTNYSRMRVIVMVAVKNDLALIAGAVGPYRAFGPDFGSGKPSAANLQLALDMGKYVNSFSWRGDPPR